MPADDGLSESLAAAVREHLGESWAVEDLASLSGGSSRELWRFDAAAAGRPRRELVLRRDPPGVEDPEAQAREWEVLCAAHAAGVPTPRPHWRDPATGMVVERLQGEAIPRRLLRDDRYARARAGLNAELGAAAAAVASVAVADVGSLPPPGGPPAEAALHGLEVELDRIGEPHPALEAGLRVLHDRLPDPVDPGLVHGDLRLGNVMVGDGGLVALLDWELAHLGDPAEDLGWLCVRSWRFGADDRPVAGVGGRDALLEAYAAAGGREISREELWFWEAYGNLRWGVICLVQADLHLSNRRPSLELAAIGRRTCEAEWDLLAMLQ